MVQEGIVWLDAARATVAFVGESTVRDRWSEPSSLPLMTVADLTGHLIHSGILMVSEAFAIANVSESKLVTAAKLMSWVPPDPESPIHGRVREVAGSRAAQGLDDLVERATSTLDEIAVVVATVSPDRVLALPAMPTLSLTTREFFRSRIIELVVHVDDLANSVGRQDIPLDAQAIIIACQLATEIDIVRHGPTAVVQALCRPGRSSIEVLRTF